MAVTTSGYIMLGMLSLGSRSGYEIRRSAELSLRHFWSISPPQVYGELAKLEEAGLVAGADEPHGNRRRRTFTVTSEGEQALKAWLVRDEPADLELRDLLQVKLFFADVLDRDEIRALVAAMRARSQAALRKLDEDVLPAAAKTMERQGVDLPPRIAHLHVELHEFLVGWCDRVEREIG